MATVKQCDCCGKVYTPESSKSNEYRFRVSDTEPTLHILDLCYDCLDKLETLMGGRKHTPGWKNQTHVKSKTTASFARTMTVPKGINGLYKPEDAPCCCETGLENAVTYDPVVNRTASVKMTNPVQTSINGKETE